MIYNVLADMVFLLHILFIVYVVFGAILVLRWRKTIWIHIPMAIWGVIVEWGNIICPLTPLENHLRSLAGGAEYELSFTEQYLYPLVYLEALNRELQFLLGILVIAVNVLIYGFILRKSKKNI
ncbi:DUF2784 domain-containing protein [Labilibacter sediminis]|nr:DUF2784 domain-containing protein [Labilibacter sediminis]